MNLPQFSNKKGKVALTAEKHSVKAFRSSVSVPSFFRFQIST